MFKIGNVEIKNRIGLAPMAGISNPSYMTICEDMGIGWAVTELISSEAIVRNNKKTLEMLNGIDSLDIPIGIQIFGSDPNTMASSAKMLCNYFKNIAFIDINMGCPVPKVAIRAQAGSSLLKNPDKVYEIVSKVVEVVNIPVTVKIRSGWDNNSINAVSIAQIIESAGASAITVHPRTRSQGYQGKSDWSIIKKVKENVNIPVIGNGDILSCYDAKRMILETNCDAVMIGRGALGNPWLLKECVDYLEYDLQPIKVSEDEKLNMILRHLNLLKDNKSEYTAVLEMRNHAAWYLKGIKNSIDLKNKIFKVKTIYEFEELIKDFINNKSYDENI